MTRRERYAAFLGGAALASAWGHAKSMKALTEQQRGHQCSVALQIWESEGGRVPGRSTNRGVGI